MSNSFRDLERLDSAHRKDAVLMATISGLEYLERPSRQDMARFSRLFMPLFDASDPQTRRTASAALSRLSRVPDDVAEMIINQPIDIAAPFIAHFVGLKESALARAVARMGAPHARAAARRSDLSPQAIRTLRGLNDPSVEGLLILRGLIPDPAKQPAGKPDASNERPKIDTPPLDPSEKLRDELRALAQRSPTPKSPLNRPTSTRKPRTEHGTPATAPSEQQVSPATRRRIADARLNQLARHAKRDHEAWFATALADAMETSFALSERIMMDLSGRQLATALIGLNAPADTVKTALECFFPHLAEPSARRTLANDLIDDLDPESCAARLSTWQRADSYTSGGPLHVPALADSNPVRPAPVSRPAAQDNHRAAPNRKTG
ncbi:hypothetical protein OEG84_00910 [Hoeflea sp. G2-23]|uniref:DUF2336 domain-containing protein n=1 Tax=Hoeflea algicola TaxID=2983763 RepID=A0ABT3Z4J7_9HYPH|nr:hypothetical protein [Hoeflea algicola]MCY0146314.1 hypothetical protein [Hoeflea algicola]